MYIYILLFISGSIFASFIHLYVTRTLKNESIIAPQSHCTECGHYLSWYELIPIFSYLFQRGKCSKCKSKIGIDSFLAEIFLGMLFVIIYMIYGATYKSLIGFVLAAMLLAIIISDFKEMIILDSTLVVSVILIYAIIFGALGLRGIYKSFLYGIFAFVLMFLIKILGDKLFGRESLGGGDIKLAFIMGSVLPYNMFLTSIAIASFIAFPYALVLSFSTKNKELAFGPFLALGLFIIFLVDKDIIEILELLV